MKSRMLFSLRQLCQRLGMGIVRPLLMALDAARRSNGIRPKVLVAPTVMQVQLLPRFDAACRVANEHRERLDEDERGWRGDERGVPGDRAG